MRCYHKVAGFLAFLEKIRSLMTRSVFLQEMTRIVSGDKARKDDWLVSLGK